MQNKSDSAEKAICGHLADLCEVRRLGDLTIDPAETPAGVWVSVTGDEPVCGRQRLTLTCHVRVHADTDPDRSVLDALSAKVLERMQADIPALGDAAVLPPSGGDYSLDDGFHILTFNQTIHIREV